MIATTLEQSKKLAEILPLDSADMWWSYFYDVISDYGEYDKEPMLHKPVCNPDEAIPCWSLAALLDQLEDTSGLAKEYGLWFCYDNRKSYCTKHYDNPVDACVEMILKLKEEMKRWSEQREPKVIKLPDMPQPLTLREQAAIVAMQGAMNYFGYNREEIARIAVEQADALIDELNKD